MLGTKTGDAILSAGKVVGSPLLHTSGLVHGDLPDRRDPARAGHRSYEGRMTREETAVRSLIVG